MTDFANPFFWLNFLYFFLAVIIAFVIPGWVILGRIKIDINNSAKLILCTTVGMVLFAWQGLMFGYLHLRWLTYIYLLMFFIIWIIERKRSKNRINFKNLRIDWIVVAIILAGIIFQLASVWYTAVKIGDILYFCCGDVRDNILNMAITNQVIKNIPPFEPGYYGKYITNYHYWGSIVIGELVRVFRLPLMATSYQYMTFLISLLLGLNAVAFSQVLKIGKGFVRWLVFLLYFGSDLVWAFVLVLRGQQIFDMSAMESGPKFLENFPRAFAITVLLAGFCLFILWLKKKDIKLGILIALVFAAIVGFKVYAAFFIFPGLILLAIYFIFKKEIRGLYMIALTFILSAIIYFPVNSGAGGLYFIGTWRFENFVVQPYLGALNRMELARLIYLAHNNYIRVAGYELLYAAVFVISTFGLKLLGFFQSRKSISIFPFEFNVILICGIITSAIAGAFFNQTSGGANTFNFLVSVFIFGAFYTALALSFWTEKFPKFVVLFIIIVVVGLSLPRDINEIYRNFDNINKRNGFVIYNEELIGLKKLSEISTNSLVLVDPTDKMDYQTPYVSLFSDKNMFLSGQGDELDAHGINFGDRKKILDTIFHSNDASIVGKDILRSNIGYIYMRAYENMQASDSAQFIDKIYSNSRVKILKINDEKIKKYLEKQKNV